MIYFSLDTRSVYVVPGSSKKSIERSRVAAWVPARGHALRFFSRERLPASAACRRRAELFVNRLELHGLKLLRRRRAQRRRVLRSIPNDDARVRLGRFPHELEPLRRRKEREVLRRRRGRSRNGRWQRRTVRCLGRRRSEPRRGADLHVHGRWVGRRFGAWSEREICTYSTPLIQHVPQPMGIDRTHLHSQTKTLTAWAAKLRSRC
jgi:hypothetical protein